MSNRNEMNYFNDLPQADISRSKFNRPQEVKPTLKPLKSVKFQNRITDYVKERTAKGNR